MLIIGCDYHPSVQQIAFVNAETGESGERRLLHKDGEAERFYRDLKLRGVSSTHMGTESGESRCASTALASASAGADAHADHESAAGSGDE